MEKRVTGIYVAVLIVGILYAVFNTFLSRHDNDKMEEKEAVIWDRYMELTKEDGVYYYKRILPVKDTNEKAIVYNTVHMRLEVLIDGKQVYELKEASGRAVKTTGVCWNVIPLSDDDAGKEIVFQVTPIYRDSAPRGSFYYGTYRGIEHKILAERIGQFIAAGIIVLTGIALLLYTFFAAKKGQGASAVMHFGIFAVLLGVWSINETQILDWIFPRSMVVVFVSHVLLMVLPIPFILFLRCMYHNKENKLWGICCYVNCAVAILRIFLQIIGVYDLRETLLATHICLLLCVMVVVLMTIQEIAANELSRQVRINNICVMVTLLCILLELIFYRFYNKSVPLTSFGFLVYISVAGIMSVRRSSELIERAKETAIYHRLAFTDELTGLSNRAAFKEDLETRKVSNETPGESKVLPTVVFMFDLNNLKMCNDTFGHDYGDQYIKMAAGALKEIFTTEGKCYRLGGDEFCAWTPYVSLEAVDEKLRILEQSLKELDDRGFVVPVTMAMGYAVYREDEDEGELYSTMKRADTMMYERKKEYKRKLVLCP